MVLKTLDYMMIACWVGMNAKLACSLIDFLGVTTGLMVMTLVLGFMKMGILKYKYRDI